MINIKLKKIAITVVSCILFASFSITQGGCNNNVSSSNDIISQKLSSKSKTQITVLVKYAFGINGFEKLVEEKFPDIDIVQIGNYTSDMGIDEYAARLEHDDIPDIVMTWPLDVGKEYWEDRLIDLSGMDFTSKYSLSMLNDISVGGKLYYLPGPAQIRGIVYNKTLFNENGWKVPTGYEEFITLCKAIEGSGMRSIQLGFKNHEVLDTALIGYNYSSTFSNPDNVREIANTSSASLSCKDYLSPALDVFKRMIDEGIWKASDLKVDYSAREDMLFNRQCAMVEDSVLMARMGFSQTGTTDEFAIMPFLSPGTQEDWARLYMVCYLGLSRHLLDSENNEKYAKVLKLMQYISTPEGQEALSTDTGAMYSSLVDSKAPDVKEIADIAATLDAGRYAIFSDFGISRSSLHKGLSGMLTGELTTNDVIKLVDDSHSSPTDVGNIATVLGTAVSDFNLIETGSFVTDAMRTKTGADVALFLDNGKDGLYNGKGISGSLYEGDVTTTDVKRILPDLKYGDSGLLSTVAMTGSNLKSTLEHAIPVNNNMTGWFYYFSGLKLQFSPTEAPGSRIKSIAMGDGSPFDENKIYSVAVMNETVPAKFIKEKVEFGITIHDMLIAEIESQGKITPPDKVRFLITE